MPSSSIKSHNSPFFLIFVQDNKNDSAPMKKPSQTNTHGKAKKTSDETRNN